MQPVQFFSELWYFVEVELDGQVVRGWMPASAVQFETIVTATPTPYSYPTPPSPTPNIPDDESAPYMDDYFYVQFSTTEQTGQMFIQNAQSLSQLLQRLQSAMNNLYASGLQGVFLDELQARADYIFNTLRYFCDESDEAGQELLMVVRIMRELDAEYARRFQTTATNSLDNFFTGFIEQRHTAAVLPNYHVPEFVRERIGDEYGLYDNISHLDTILPGWQLGLSDDMVNFAFIKGAGLYAAHHAVPPGFGASVINSPVYGTALVGVGVASGIVDWYLSDDHSTEAFAKQTISGGVQTIMGFTPLGRGILVADAATQFIGHHVSQQIENNALWLANGDSELAQEFVQTADKFQQALDAGSLDARMDGVVNALITGDSEALGEEIMTGVWGVSNIITQGTQLTIMTIDSVETRVGIEITPWDEVLSPISNLQESLVDGLFSVFP